jgi:hypothetical protein
VRRVVQDGRALFVLYLPGVQGEPDGAVRPVAIAELLQRRELAVDERVHRIDHNGADGVAGRIAAHHLVEDGQQVGEALARAGARADDVRVAALRRFERLLLVPVQAQAVAEEAGRFGSDYAARLEVAERGAGFERRVKLKDGVRPRGSIRWGAGPVGRNAASPRKPPGSP